MLVRNILLKYFYNCNFVKQADETAISVFSNEGLFAQKNKP